jgi:CBS domain-containing protein/anti-sigma regulatory factor (Ser/Thr protein kinase)
MQEINFKQSPGRFKGKIITDQFADKVSRVEELAYILKVREVMTSKLVSIPSSSIMKDVLDTLREHHISGVLIVDNDHLKGLVSTEDLIRCLVDRCLNSSVGNYMSTNLLTVHDFDSITEALRVFSKTGLGRLPVLDNEKKLVGIITKGDITTGILKALEHDYHEEEVRRYRASHLFEDIESERSSLVLRYNLKHYDFIHGGTASGNIKRALLRLGANPQLARRVGIAAYEAEMNLIIHATHGGSIHVEIESQQISIYAWDDGPGIEDIEKATKPGFSTAPQEILDLGFGAGMGLYNIKRCVDEMNLVSEMGKGTHLTMKFFLLDQDSVGEGYLTSKE